MNKKENKHYPFTAIKGQEDLKSALMLNIVDPTLGGVLAIGDKGTGKTTTIRALAELMSQREQFPFVNLPMGATEDRVMGHIELEKLINEKREILKPGLMAQAHGGFLYIDEVNLLNDYLMDVLLDASASGEYYLEREGMSATLSSRFGLIGSMNAEEGGLRPQLKDRFGLCVHVKTVEDVNIRKQIIKDRMRHDDDSVSFAKEYEEQENTLFDKITQARKNLGQVIIPENIYELSAQLACEHKVEGHRADILLVKTSRAYASFQGRDRVEETDLDAVADYVLAHRSNNDQDNSSKNDSSQDQQIQEENENESESEGLSQAVFAPVMPEKGFQANLKRGKGSQSTDSKRSSQGIEKSPKIDYKNTVGQYIAKDKFELRHKTQSDKSLKHLIFILDSSGSMISEKIASYAKGYALKSMEDKAGLVYSLVAMNGGTAQVLVNLSNQLDEVHTKISELESSGKTNAVEALKIAGTLIQKGARNELIMITDGRFNSEEGDNIEKAVMAFRKHCKGINRTYIIDSEAGFVKLGLAEKLAKRINADYDVLKREGVHS
ncbi:AAA family ATPase [Aureibacter tunicatorum]|uniref:Magnesium chelatase subunit D n=1 Tax=Aureibacter tunicatorum TaxID=866807 RepID=A0AAE4BRS9_9BACT|nr:AAA family ATPase [Aureibacter tunicatorum]MDR6237552.1 magnesium chelatase subunit D [Aureibacter tunicatorum]BDD02586.1 hypothetical protein AUTU_00690 [Aureibacter tunicatorum]